MPPASAAASNVTLVWFGFPFFFPFRRYSYDMKEVQPGLVDMASLFFSVASQLKDNLLFDLNQLIF